MPIWFVSRSPYCGPMSKHVRRFDGADTLLDWFRSVWRAFPDSDEAAAYTRELLGTHAYFSDVFVADDEEQFPPPGTMEQLHCAMRRALLIVEGGEYRGGDDTIQVLTVESESALYWFTDAFAKAHPLRVAYLLREDWRLPEEIGPGGFTPKPGVHVALPPVESEKALYLASQDWEDRELEHPIGGVKYPGLRLPDLAPWLLNLRDDSVEMDAPYLHLLRETLLEVLGSGEGMEASFRAALKEQPGDVASWNAYTDWLVEQDRPPADLHLLAQALSALLNFPQGVQVGPHCAAQIKAESWSKQLFLFDDLWASGNEELANALLDYHGRFNVLDDWGVPNRYGPSVPAGEEKPW
jgi:uncharacterized protein (TIGR02996 family)